MPPESNPSKVVAAIISRQLYKQEEILLIRPNTKESKWSLPSGKINENEKARDAAILIVKNETGLDYFPEFLFDSGETVAFKGHVGEKIKGAVKDTKWVDLSNVVDYNLDDRHKRVLQDYIEKKPDAVKQEGYLEELSYLRAEVLNRFDIRNKMLQYTILLAGALLTFGKAEGFLLFPVLGTAMAALWSHSDYRIFEIGNYVKQVIEPRFAGLNWESYISEKYSRLDKKEGKKQESYVLWIFHWSYIILFVFAVIKIFLKNVTASDSFTDIFSSITDNCNLGNIIIIVPGVIILIVCRIKTTSLIKKRRKN